MVDIDIDVDKCLEAFKAEGHIASISKSRGLKDFSEYCQGFVCEYCGDQICVHCFTNGAEKIARCVGHSG